MKHKHLTILLALLLSNFCIVSSAHDFEVDGIYYKITSSTELTVAVTYRGTSYNSYSNEYTGSVTIPEAVVYNGTTYSITSIGDRAFKGCNNLTNVSINSNDIASNTSYSSSFANIFGSQVKFISSQRVNTISPSGVNMT